MDYEEETTLHYRSFRNYYLNFTNRRAQRIAYFRWLEYSSIYRKCDGLRWGQKGRDDKYKSRRKGRC